LLIGVGKDYVRVIDEGDTTMAGTNSKFMSGCNEIADYIGETPRRTFTLLVEKKIPAWKEGKLWRANKESLDRHYEELEQNAFRSIGDAPQVVVNSIRRSSGAAQ
jgi:hypothetical protein